MCTTNAVLNVIGAIILLLVATAFMTIIGAEIKDTLERRNYEYSRLTRDDKVGIIVYCCIGGSLLLVIIGSLLQSIA